VSNEWRERLNGLLEEENTLHNTAAALRERDSEFSGNVQTLTVKTAKTQTEGCEFSENPQNLAAKTAETPSEAERLGLVATWSTEFGYVSLHDPTSGEWHDLLTREASPWATWEARRRKELYGDGNRKAYRLTSREMAEIWKAERAPETEGIVEEHPLEEEEE
jgi:hypothetical protein